MLLRRDDPGRGDSPGRVPPSDKSRSGKLCRAEGPDSHISVPPAGEIYLGYGEGAATMKRAECDTTAQGITQRRMYCGMGLLTPRSESDRSLFIQPHAEWGEDGCPGIGAC